jgi:hypothetical protein
MNKTGFSRPGALQMIVSAALMLLGSIGPLFVAFTVPDHEWSFYLTGLPVLGLSILGIATVILYIVGFLRYCGSKGYSKWLGVWLLFGHLFGLIVLLLLPDLEAYARAQTQPIAKIPEATGKSTGES